MGNALLSGVSGLQAHQKMLDVAGANLANINTTAYKSSRVTFSDLLSETLRDAGQPTTVIGGTNPVQVGSGVQVSSIDKNMTQGSMVNTGQSLDMAIEGSGFFVLSDGTMDVFTRVGSFAVDSDFYLVDPATGYRVQRIGTEGVAEGFQSIADDSIRIPYDVALPARSTTTVSYTGNLSADSDDATVHTLITDIAYTVEGTGAAVSTSALLEDMSQVTTDPVTGDEIQVSVIRRDGTTATDNLTITLDADSAAGASTANGDHTAAVTTIDVAAGGAFGVGDLIQASGSSEIMEVTAVVANALTVDRGYGGTTAAAIADTTDIDILATTVGHLLGKIDDLLGGDATATLNNGKIEITEAQAGYSQVDLDLAMTSGSTGAITFPKYFEIETAGGEEVRATNVLVFDSQGIAHNLAASFVRSAANTWDLVVTSIEGDVDIDNDERRIKDIAFQADGSFGGVAVSELRLTFAHDPSNERTIDVDFGTIGEYDGIQQLGGASTAVASDQDGYSSGYLTGMSVTREGVLTGVFTNGVRRDIAAIKLATFQNAEGLQAIGNNYFQPTSNSGNPVPTKALAGGTGAVSGSTLERSNVEVAQEFVNLIQAQNGFQANARTIRIANEMLRELGTLIR